MSINRTWSIQKFDVRPGAGKRKDIVSRVYWRLDAVDCEVTSFAEGHVDLPEPETDFTPFGKLTEAQAVEWVKAALGETTVQAYEAYVDRQIAQQVTPPTVEKTPPWLPPTEAETSVEEV